MVNPVLVNDDTTLIITTIVILFGIIANANNQRRSPSNFEQRLMWDRIVETHGSRATFHRHMRMRRESFGKLLSYIRDDLEVSHLQASRRGGAILPQLRLYCTIRWLAGGSYSDIYMYVGISKSSFFRIIWQTIDAIVNCPEMKMKFPQSAEECVRAAAEFATISRGGAITNCVGVCDGYLLEIRAPSRDVVGNVRSYFSGHYQRYGVNIQAVSDHLSRFIYFAVAGPGVMGDNIAIQEIDLFDLIHNLPIPFCVIGDAAYQPTEHLVSMYYGANKRTKKYDNFNFYASQLRIRVEMAFGLMTKKWGILWRPVIVDIQKIKYLAIAIACIHNFCINERVLDPEAGHPDPAIEARIFGRTQCIEDIALAAAAAEIEAGGEHEFNGWSANREQMVQTIENLGLERVQLTRPQEN